MAAKRKKKASSPRPVVRRRAASKKAVPAKRKAAPAKKAASKKSKAAPTKKGSRAAPKKSKASPKKSKAALAREVARLQKQIAELTKKQRRRQKKFEAVVPSTGKKRREKTPPIPADKNQKKQRKWRRQHPDVSSKSLIVEGEQVRSWLKAEMERIAEERGGTYRSYLYDGSAEVLAALTFSQSIGGFIQSIARISDSFAPMTSGLYYGEMYFQARATFRTGKQDGPKSRNGSPLGQSRVGPDGHFYDTAKTYWFHGDVMKCLLVLRLLVERVRAGTRYKLEEIEVRSYWSPEGRRPER